MKSFLLRWAKYSLIGFVTGVGVLAIIVLAPILGPIGWFFTLLFIIAGAIAAHDEDLI